MTRRALTASAFLVFTLISLTLISASATRDIPRVSQVLNTGEPFSVIAILPDIPAFITALREGKASRGFFDSPLGLHFLRSAPLRGAAHLHKLISLAPRSWQWNLYTLISDGPVFYRSHGKKFSLVIALNKKGQILTSLLSDAHAAKTGDWFVIASDKETLKAQLDYLQNPVARDFNLDGNLKARSAISFAFGSVKDTPKSKSLTRTLLQQAFGTQNYSQCALKLTPGNDAIQLEGECLMAMPAKTKVAAADEIVTMADFPGYVYFQKPEAKAAYVLALGGFAADYGYLIPQLFYSGPASDQKSLEFLSQAFKTKSHILENKDGALQIRYPHPYSYAGKKFDLFAPHLVANRERFFWNSYLPEKKPGEMKISVSSSYNLYSYVKIHPLVKNSEAALKQFDAIYSPGHFNEFRDALFKSLPALKTTSLKLFTQPSGQTLRIGGALAFADI